MVTFRNLRYKYNESGCRCQCGKLYKYKGFVLCSMHKTPFQGNGAESSRHPGLSATLSSALLLENMRDHKPLHAVVVLGVDVGGVKNIHHIELCHPGRKRPNAEGKLIGSGIKAVVGQLCQIGRASCRGRVYMGVGGV